MAPDFVLLTGFLGSGKTTLLSDLLTGAAAADTAVIVNEVGEIGLDGVVLREAGGDVPIAMLANGCVCCAMGSDLAITLDALLAAERPSGAGPLRRIVLETSGLSSPGPILRQLAALAAWRMRVCVVATFDAVRGLAVAEFNAAAWWAEGQWAAAHRIVVTKADLVDAGTLAQRAAQIGALNPLAEVVANVDRASTVAAAFAPLTGMAMLTPAPYRGGETVHPRIATRLLRPSRLFAYDELAMWLDNLAGALGDRLLRLKGLVRVHESEAPLLVESVGTLFAAPRPLRQAPETAFLVVIARDLAPREIASVQPADLFRVSRRPARMRAERVPAFGDARVD